MRWKKLHPDAKLTRGSANSAGYDLYSLQSTCVPPHGKIKLPTGVAVEIPPGYVGLILDRSSMAAHGFRQLGGVIDSDYRGEIFVVLGKVSGGEYSIMAGDRIAQLVVVPCWTAEPQEAEELSATQRGEGGFGSTGR